MLITVSLTLNMSMLIRLLNPLWVHGEGTQQVSYRRALFEQLWVRYLAQRLEPRTLSPVPSRHLKASIMMRRLRALRRHASGAVPRVGPPDGAPEADLSAFGVAVNPRRFGLAPDDAPLTRRCHATSP